MPSYSQYTKSRTASVCFFTALSSLLNPSLTVFSRLSSLPNPIFIFIMGT